MRDGNVVAAARAGSRLRLEGATVSAAERLAARTARGRLGRAIREARYRRAHPVAVAAPYAATITTLAVAGPSRVGHLSVFSAAALVVLMVVSLIPRPVEDVAPPPPAAAAPAISTPIPDGVRGRTTTAVSVVPTPAPAPPPSAAPTEAPAATTAPVVGPVSTAAPAGVPSGVTGGVPGGVVGGTGTKTPAPATPRPTPTLNLLPLTPPPLALGANRFLFLVTDSATGQPLAGVCVIHGTSSCAAGFPHTNALGYYWLDEQPNESRWSFEFQHPDYWPIFLPPLSYQPGMGTTPIPVRLRRR